MQKKGFTLLELVIVIGILAVLGTVSILVLNPAELFKQARDTTRINDFKTISSALGLYLSTVSSTDLGTGVDFTCGTNWGTTGDGTDPAKRVAATGAAAYAAVYGIDGTGWVAVDFRDIPGGSPLAILPRDPVNDATYDYQYSCDDTAKTFELNTQMESIRYSNTGDDDVESTDGGSSADHYEVGTAPGLAI